MKNDFIYDLMKSKEIREFYRNNIELSIEEQICIITHSYNELSVQLEFLKKLHENADNSDKDFILNIVNFYEDICDIYNYPYKFFGNDCRIVYILEWLDCDFNKYQYNMDLFDIFDESCFLTDIFDDIDSVVDAMNQSTSTRSFNINLLIVPNDKSIKSYFALYFYCNKINNKWVPIRFSFDDDILKNKNYRYAINHILNTEIKHKRLPFNNNSKVKFQTPVMDKPFYGVLKHTNDGNDCWYSFMYPDPDSTGKPIMDDFLDMSYTNLGNTISNYAVFDWLTFND